MGEVVVYYQMKFVFDDTGKVYVVWEVVAVRRAGSK